MMCEYCKSVNGDIDSPIINKTQKYGKLRANLSVWVKNDDSRNVHQLMYSVDFGDSSCPTELIDGTIKIHYCPMCGRKL